MATIGTLVAFDEKSQTWEDYCEILEQFFAANGIDDGDRQRAILISVVGPATYRLMKSLISPEKPKDKTYQQLVLLLKNHFDPKPSEVVQRFKFEQRNRKADEAVMDYVAELRRLAQDCNYGDTLQGRLRDRIVCGINDDRTQRRLLAESDLTYEKTLQIAVSMESANKNARDLQTVSDAGKCFNVTGDPREARAASREDVRECYRCKGTRHTAAECRFKQEKCHACGKVGHIARACLSKAKTNQGGKRPTERDRRQRPNYRSHKVQENQDESECPSSEDETFSLSCMTFRLGRMSEMHLRKVDPYMVEMKLNGKKVDMEIDTGCSLTVMNEDQFNSLWSETKRPKVKPVKIKLETYTGDPVGVIGVAQVKIAYKQQTETLPLVVVKGEGPSLLGRGWLEDIHLNWKEIKSRHGARAAIQNLTVGDKTTLQRVLSQNEGVFKEEMGTLKGTKATIHVKENASPRFFRPRSVPYAMRAKVDEEIDRLLKEDVITPVKYSEWAAPVVPILKPNGTIRLCGDYKLTVNTVSSLEQYPIPKLEDLLAALSGGKQFSKLDMSHAYQQILMDEESKKFLTVNTHRGLFTYNRLPFGVASAPAIFQRTMESLLRGIPFVAIYLDDILITGETEADHLANLAAVLMRLKEAGLKLRRNKCIFMQEAVEYLGHRVDAQGLHPVQNKVKAIVEAPAPTTVTELKSYLGLLNYYGRFLPNLSTLLAPLHELLRKDVRWTWKKKQEEAFQSSKALLNSAAVLVHYSADRELILSCDASPYGVGAVLSHRMEDGSERPLGFMSRTLAPAEKGYSQLDKEGLAVMFGIRKFHKYLYGRTFTIYTDHKPLVSLFDVRKAIPQMGSPRVQRWAVHLSAYEYKIVYKEGKSHANADALSRLPLRGTGSEKEETEQVLMMDLLDDSLVDTQQLKRWTARDVILSQVHEYVLKGWPTKPGSQFQPYHQRQMELSVRDGCVLWGARVIIPTKGREKILKLLHQSHSGMSRMKSLARSYVWWPGMDQDVEKEVRACEECQKHQKSPPSAPLHPWEWPEAPWSRIHMDYAGPFLGEMFLIIVDSHSKWMDVYPMKTSTSHATIEKLRQSFSIFGLPKMAVSDNGSCFTSAEFETFMKNNGIQHVRSAPFHPSSNGLAERAVQTFKDGMLKTKGETIQTRVSRFLFSYRITPHATTGLSPAELMMARRPRSQFDLLMPDVKSKVQQKQMKQKRYHDSAKALRCFAPGDKVYIKNYSYGPKWIPAVIHSSSGPVSYTVIVGNGRVVKRHVDQVRARLMDSVPSGVPEEEAVVSSDTIVGAAGLLPAAMDVGEPQPDLMDTIDIHPQLAPEVQVQSDPPAVPVTVLRRSERERRAPAHLSDFVS